MEVLPIKSVREEDAPLIGTDLYHLSKLAQLDFPVASGVIALPPQLKIKTLLEHLPFKDGEVFEQRLTLLSSQIKQIPIPDDLEKTLIHHKINTQKLWFHLLEFWINQLRFRLWQEGFSPDLTSHLSAQPVFFTDKITSSGFCFFNRDLKVAIFEVENGELTEHQKQELEDLIKNADKKLLLPQIYSFVIGHGIKIVKVTPFTQYPVEKEEADQLLPEEFKTEKLEQPKFKSVVKVFLQTDGSFKTDHDADGAIVNSIDHSGINNADGKILHLVETAQSLSGKPVIFNLFDNPKSSIRGALQLIHRLQSLKDEVEVVKFARNKKHLANIGICIPFLRSAEELLRLKIELSSLGITRQGNLKLWVEFSVPENFLNLEEYLEKGIDGVLINLDELSVRIGGFDPQAEEGIFYSKQIKAVLKLLEPTMKILHKEKIPAIATGSLAIHDDVLDFLIERGIYGISVDFANFLSIHERLRLIEKRVIKSRS